MDWMKERLCAKLREQGTVKPCCMEPSNLEGPFKTDNEECVIYVCSVCSCRKWVLDGNKAFSVKLDLQPIPLGGSHGRPSPF